MAVREIVKEGCDCLQKTCRPVTDFDERLQTLVADMKDTLKKAEGLGLAGPQVGVLRRLFVFVDDDEQMKTVVNPVLSEMTGEQEATEGCLSVPGVWGKTKRPAHVTVEGFDEYGKPVKYSREGITAVCFCHETDHLDGKLFRTHVFEYVERD
ncbi:MAG: peptide deformylase [Eubacteriales bacterium]